MQRRVTVTAKSSPTCQRIGQWDATLRAVQTDEAGADRGNFGGLPPPRVFNLILSAVVGVYYAHPAAWSEIGFGGPASPRGYVRMGLDERDPWEAPLSPGWRGS